MKSFSPIKNLSSILFALNLILDMIFSWKKCFQKEFSLMVAGVARPFVAKGASHPSFSETIYPLLAEGAEKIKSLFCELWNLLAYYGPIIGKKILTTLDNGFSFSLRWIKNNPHDAKVVFISVAATLIGLIIIRKVLSIFTKTPSNHSHSLLNRGKE